MAPLGRIGVMSHTRSPGPEPCASGLASVADPANLRHMQRRPPSLLRPLLPTLAIGLAAALAPAVSPAADEAPSRLPLERFADGIHHSQNSHHLTRYPRLAADDVAGIAEHLLLYQRANGGWRENEDPRRILTAEERAALAADREKTDTGFDNGATCPQIAYLAGAYQILGDTRHRDAARRGLEFVLSAQHSSGAWPHSFPNGEAYRGLLTFADAVTPNVLRLLRAVAAGRAPFEWVEPSLRERARAAVARGDAAVLLLQIRRGGRLTGWAGQYDPITLAPTRGRSFELPSITSRETVEVLRYLIGIETPPPEVVAAVEAAAAWLQASAITGWRLETVAADAVDFQYHISVEDRRLVADPTAPPLWARFYDLTTNAPVLANREGQQVAAYEQVGRERRTGYDWYGRWPASFLDEELPAWRKRCAK